MGVTHLAHGRKKYWQVPSPLAGEGWDGGNKLLNLPLLRRGKVRDVYDLGDKLLLVSSDRLSAFDYVLPALIPGKGETLTKISSFWFEKTKHIADNHMLATEISEISESLPAGMEFDVSYYKNRTMLVKKAKRVDFECVVRGYIAGSAWKEYKNTGSACGHSLPSGLKEAQKLPEPIFTPAVKADTGHDENISFEKLRSLAGKETAEKLKQMSLKIYDYARGYLEKRGILLADTKFEFGFLDGELIVIDELVTPDSSRFWDSAQYSDGKSPESFDKQFVRDYLENSGWDKKSAPPALPEEVITGTAERYKEALERVLS